MGNIPGTGVLVPRTTLRAHVHFNRSNCRQFLRSLEVSRKVRMDCGMHCIVWVKWSSKLPFTLVFSQNVHYLPHVAYQCVQNFLTYYFKGFSSHLMQLLPISLTFK